MSFTWSVQPYRWLSELRDNYTHFLTTTTRNQAEELVPQAEQWMRENAPWQDRPDDQRTRWEQEIGHARENLTVKILKDTDEEKFYNSGLRQAEKVDAAKLRQMNADRKRELAAFQSAWEKRARDAGQKRIRDAPGWGFSQQMYYGKLKKPRTSVPKSRSAVAQFHKLEAQKFPLVTVQFAHNNLLRYAIWLEIANGGRYSIIAPALDYWGPKFIGMAKRIANLVQYQNVDILGNIRHRDASPEAEIERFQRFTGQFGESYTPFVRSVKQQRRADRLAKKRASGDTRKKFQQY